MTFNEFISRFEVEKRRNDHEALCHCPCKSNHKHGDKNPSLLITEKNGKILLYCYVHCSSAEILGAVGLKYSDCYTLNSDHKWISWVEKETEEQFVDYYNYTDISGKYHHSKIRLIDQDGEKDFRTGWLWNEKFIFSGKKHPLKAQGTVYGKTAAIKQAIADGKPVFLPEGEKDVDTLTRKGYAAITYGSANSWCSELSTLFENGNVYVLADDDGAGHDVAKQIKKDLEGIAASVKIILPMPNKEGGDITDFFATGHTIEEFEEILQAPESEFDDSETAEGCDTSEKDENRLQLVSAADLSQMVFDPLRFIVDDLITAGLTIVAGAPKSGKSWLLLDMCASVATGTPFLGRKTLQCDVLYLALEDSLNRLQARLDKVLDGREAPANLTLAIRCADLNNGLFDQLEEYCAENPDAGLIVIDTFQRIRSGGGRSDNMYSVDYKEVGQLKHFADDHKIALVLIHHTRKMRDMSDDFMNVSGTLGITGAADTTIVLTKDQDDTTKISITGRDVEMQDYQMEFQKANCRWRIVGTSEEVEEQRARKDYDNNPVVLTVKKLLDQNNGEWKGSASELIRNSRCFGTPIRGTEQKLGKSLGTLADLMYQYDQITYQAIKNGSGAKIHRFEWLYDPEDDILFD